MKRVYELDVYKLAEVLSDMVFLVPMLQRGNAYHIGSHAGAWEPVKSEYCVIKLMISAGYNL